MIMVVFTSMRKTRTGSAVGNSTDVCFGCVMCLCVCVCALLLGPRCARVPVWVQATSCLALWGLLGLTWDQALP